MWCGGGGKRGWVRVGGRAGSRIYLQLLLVPPGPRTPSLKLRLRRALIRFSDQPSPAHPSTHTPSCTAAHPSGCHYELLWSSISKDSNEVENIFASVLKYFCLWFACTLFLKFTPPAMHLAFDVGGSCKAWRETCNHKQPNCRQHRYRRTAHSDDADDISLCDSRS